MHGDERLRLWNEFSQDIGASPELTLILRKMQKSWRRQRAEGLH